MTKADEQRSGSGGRSTDPALAELEEQIAHTRQQLGETVEKLAAKADVPARARAKAHETAERVRAGAQRGQAKVTEAGHGATGRVTAVKGKVADKVPGRGGGSGNGRGSEGTTAVRAATTKETAAGKLAAATGAAHSAGSHLAETAHTAGSRAGRMVNRSGGGTSGTRASGGGVRETYLPLAAGVTAAAGAGAAFWLKHRGDVR